MDLENEAITDVIDSVLKCLFFQNEKYSITERISLTVVYCTPINQHSRTAPITIVSFDIYTHLGLVFL